MIKQSNKAGGEYYVPIALRRVSFVVILIFIISIIFFKFNLASGIKRALFLWDRKVYLGAWVGGFWDNDKKQLHTEKLVEFENKIGKKVAIASFYRGWAEIEDPKLIDDFKEISSHGWTPMISANPYFFDDCIHKTDSLYKTIASGACDNVLRSISKNFRSYGDTIFFRFAWEANIVDVDWGVQRVGSTPQNFIQAWRHFHEIMQEEQANNVVWVLAFNTSKHDSIAYDQLYPGNDYVDWVGIDGYNWGETQEWSDWQSFSGVFDRSYNELIALAPDKPLMISEFNSASVGGDKAAWFEDALQEQIPYKYPKIEAIVFFNEDRTTQEGVDWLFIEQKLVDIIKQNLKSSIYRSGLK